jgi:hypothetical protein
MDINSVITREEYTKVENLNYDQFCNYLMKLVKLCVEESLKSLPFVLTHLSSQVAYLKGLSDEFYKQNKDLNQHRKLMVQTIESVEGENPGKTYEEILKIAAGRARKVIAEMSKVTDTKPIELKQFDSKLKAL